MVLVLDFGSQFTQLIAREVRSLGVFCEIEPFNISREKLERRKPRALILSGGPASVKDGPKLVESILSLDVPVLGICYGMQLLSHLNRGKVVSGTSREYGLAEIEILKAEGLFDGFSAGETARVWMSHGDTVTAPPQGALVTARSSSSPVVGYRLGQWHGVQFHPEVHHTPIGKRILKNFLFNISNLKSEWEVGDLLKEKGEEILAKVGNDDVVGAVSGGVDSSILAVFLGKILGKRFHPFLVDTGLLRHNEAEDVKKFLKSCGVDLNVIKAEKIFLDRLKGVRDPERKRKIVGKTFIDVFEKQCKKIKRAKWLAQGTLYPDVIESVSVRGPSHTIKTHHNVGGLPKRMKLGLIEPFRELFKDEVRELGRKLSVPESVIMRHPFPGPGLALRILGDITKAKADKLREVDKIYIDELKAQNLYSEIWQAFSVLLPVQSVGVMGDGRTYESVVALRAVTSRDGMTADWYDFPKPALQKIATRIVNEVSGVNRVVYDVTTKPPATIEWE